MIKLTRQPLPEALLTRTTERAMHLRQLLGEGSAPPQALLDSYRDPELKQHLVNEAHNKCGYCESKITHVYFGDIEHVRPKAVFPAERLDVNNLVLACAKCNHAKGQFWDAVTPLLNPYDDNPEKELLALGYIIAHRPGRDRARVTVHKLELNRASLIERRQERVELLQSLADQYVKTESGTTKDILRTELLRHAADAGEYAFIVRSYLKAACDLEYVPAA